MQSVDRALDEFDRLVGPAKPLIRAPTPSPPTGDWSYDWEAFREASLRGSLEEVAWRLEQRGHHAWLEDSDGGAPGGPTGSDPPADDDDDGVDAGRGDRLRPLALCTVPAGSQPGPGTVSRTIFRPARDGEVINVIHERPGNQPTIVVAWLTLDQLTEDAIGALTARTLRVDLLGSEAFADDPVGAEGTPPVAESDAEPTSETHVNDGWTGLGDHTLPPEPELTLGTDPNPVPRATAQSKSSGSGVLGRRRARRRDR